VNPDSSGFEPVTGRSRTFILLAIGVIAAAHLLYLSLLITCDLLRIAPRGFVPRFDDGRVTVSEVQSGSVAAEAGLMDGDRIVRANGQALVGRADWQRVNVQWDPSHPLVLELQRAGQPKTATLVLATGLQYDAPSTGVIVFRLMQLVTLALGVLVALKRYWEPPALVGALLLATLGTVSLLLPTRLAVLWGSLPEPLETLVWVPFTMSAASGPVFFAFTTIFPRRIWPKTAIALALVPGLIAPAWNFYVGRQLMLPLGPPTGVQDGVPIVFAVNVLYAAAAIALLVTHRTAASTLTERRRMGVLILGTLLGAAASVGVFAGYWRNPGRGIFTTGPMTMLSIAFLAMPASFAYAILRHRLFDIRLIVRQGLQYALARRMVDALIPALGALLIADVILHRHESLTVLIQRRWWWYVLVASAVLVVRSQREAWLSRLDRRFFRERYDAERLLRSIADQVQRASTFAAVEDAIVRQIDEALHPTFVKVLRHLPASAQFSVDSASIRPPGPATTLPTSLTVIKVLSALRKPLALALGDTAWVRHQLPLDERTMLLDQGIELLVPISGRSPAEVPDGLLLLGPRRSEEPYNAEDLQLLATIADALGALLERSASEEYGFHECAQCGRCYDGATERCVDDHHRLTPARGTVLVNGRYRLETRLGRGGMGTVYAATDMVLERPVAVKVIRDDLVTPLDLAARFRREARAAAGLSHPHIVRIYDFGTDRVGRPFLVMELLEGETLRERLRASVRVDAPEVLSVMRGVCSALTAAHDRGLVHRDLKPENIYLQRQAESRVPKVLDFGLAKALDTAQRSNDSTALGTSLGMVIGTLDYMSPEQIAGDDVSPAWDVWALTVIGHEMLTGRHPFRGALADRTGHSDSRAETTAGLLSPAAASFFARALSPRRAERPQSAAALLEGLEQVLA
jgi:hypothetical protein